MVTSRDVARAAGVSQTTVSRVVRNSDAVRPATRERVLRAFEELGYAPNAAARAMKTSRTGTIGVVVASITNPLYPEVVEALSLAIERSGRRMLLWNSGEAGERSAIEAIQQRLVDGLIFTTATLDSATTETTLTEALRHGSPCVLVTRGVEGLRCDQVVGDNRGGAALVVDYLAAAGHRRIAFVTGPQNASTSVEREQGFLASMREHGIDVLPEFLERGDFTHDAGEAVARRWLKSSAPPTAIFCANDVTAFGVLGAARVLGVHVPDDLWVVGFNDIALASWPAFDLTTVHLPRQDIATRAVERLLARIDDPDRDVEIDRFPARLVVRGSTARTPGPDPDLRLLPGARPRG